MKERHISIVLLIHKKLNERPIYYILEDIHA